MINLLPPKYKADLKREENFKLLFILEIVFFTSLLSLALILFSIKIHLAGAVEIQKIFVDLKNKELSPLKLVEEQLNLINKRLVNLDSFYAKQFKLTDFLERISGLLPEGLYLTSFSYQKEGQQINLSGFSPTVRALLEFKNNLEKQSDFKEVVFPAAVWLQLENIDFDVSLKINAN